MAPVSGPESSLLAERDLASLHLSSLAATNVAMRDDLHSCAGGRSRVAQGSKTVVVSLLLTVLFVVSVVIVSPAASAVHLPRASPSQASSESGPGGQRTSSLSNPPDWTIDPTTTGPGGLFDVSLASNPSDGSVLLFGGCSQVECSRPSNETMEFVQGQWVLLHPLNSPPGREYGTMVYDAAEAYYLLYGGESATGVLNDTWAFFGGNWHELSEATNPGPRSQANMAYDAADGLAIIFGGYACYTYCGGTWAFGDGAWKNVSEPASPPARYGAMMAYDAAVGGVILYGGVASDTGSYLSDTWEYASGNWTDLGISGPPQRESGAMGYDPTLSAVILEGGNYVTVSNFPGVTYVDTWQYTAVGWTELTTTNSPAGGTDGAMTYESSSGEMVEFGGCTASGCPNSLTYEFGNSSQLTAYVEPSSCGSIDLGGYVTLSNGSSQVVPPGSYQIVSPECAGYKFTGWSVNGLASLNNTTSNSATLNVTGSATVTASFSAVPPGSSSPTPVGQSSSGSGFPIVYVAIGVVVAAAVAGLLVVLMRRKGPPPASNTSGPATESGDASPAAVESPPSPE